MCLVGRLRVRHAPLVLLGLGAAAGAAASASASAATATVHALHAVFEAVLREAAALGYQGRYARLAPAIGTAFDSEFMARAAVGREWNHLRPDQQQRWVKSFGDFTVANYAGRLDHDTGQRFETLAEEAAENATRVVRARVVDPAAENVELTYRLRETPAGWKIIDIYLKGTVSELALRRSEYASVLKREGFDALLAHLQRKIGELAAGKVAPPPP
jgi:phospholipid transport system substrate-binding protein